MLGYDSYGRDELEAMLDKEREKVKELEKKIEDMQANEYVRSVDDGMEIHRLHRCVVKMTMKWLSAIDDMYSRLDDMNRLDDQDVLDWDIVTDLHDKMDKVLEKWK
jgi:5-bromo-4-chloroindolyl phosphate hydrolysis protein